MMRILSILTYTLLITLFLVCSIPHSYALESGGKDADGATSDSGDSGAGSGDSSDNDGAIDTSGATDPGNPFGTGSGPAEPCCSSADEDHDISVETQESDGGTGTGADNFDGSMPPGFGTGSGSLGDAPTAPDRPSIVADTPELATRVENLIENNRALFSSIINERTLTISFVEIDFDRFGKLTGPVGVKGIFDQDRNMIGLQASVPPENVGLVDTNGNFTNAQGILGHEMGHIEDHLSGKFDLGTLADPEENQAREQSAIETQTAITGVPTSVAAQAKGNYVNGDGDIVNESSLPEGRTTKSIDPSLLGGNDSGGKQPRSLLIGSTDILQTIESQKTTTESDKIFRELLNKYLASGLMDRFSSLGLTAVDIFIVDAPVGSHFDPFSRRVVLSVEDIQKEGIFLLDHELLHAGVFAALSLGYIDRDEYERLNRLNESHFSHLNGYVGVNLGWNSIAQVGYGEAFALGLGYHKAIRLASSANKDKLLLDDPETAMHLENFINSIEGNQLIYSNLATIHLDDGTAPPTLEEYDPAISEDCYSSYFHNAVEDAMVNTFLFSFRCEQSEVLSIIQSVEAKLPLTQEESKAAVASVASSVLLF